MIAVGYTSKGEILEFNCIDSEILSCSNQDLISLEIPEGVKDLRCNSNLLTELEIPNSVEYLNCNNNDIKELNIPEGVKYLFCNRNVKGLNNVNWDCNIRLL